MGQFGWELPNTDVSDGICGDEEFAETSSKHELEGFNTESEYQEKLEFVKLQVKSVQNRASKNNKALTQASAETEKAAEERSLKGGSRNFKVPMVLANEVARPSILHLFKIYIALKVKLRYPIIPIVSPDAGPEPQKVPIKGQMEPD